MDSDLDFHKDSSYKSIHFYLTQIPILLVLEIVSGFMYIKISDKFIQTFYYLPFISIYFYIILKCGWGGDWRSISRRVFFTMIGLFIFAPIFFSIYFLVWNPTLSIQWFKSSSCKPQGQFTTQLGNLERYSLQLVNINQDVLGLSCISNQKMNGNSMKNYDFYYRDDFYSCDNNYNTTGKQIHFQNDNYMYGGNRLLQLDNQYANNNNNDHTFKSMQQQQYSIKRELANQTTNQNYQNIETQPKRQGLVKRCRTQYTFSEVKIPSWLCQSVEDNQEIIENIYQDYPVERHCFYAYYGNKDKARDNGRNKSINLRESKDFVMIRYDDEFYYFKEGFICLIVLSMYPAFLFSLQAPLGYFMYRGMLWFYCESIKDENEDFRLAEQELNPQRPKKKEVVDEIGSTSQTERIKQKIEPHQIVQILSPSSQQKDRDVYDIYNNTRRKQQQQPESTINPTVMINTEEPMNVSKFNGDQTKSVMIKKEQYCRPIAKSIDDIDDYKGQMLNGPRNVTKKTIQESSSDEETNDQDCSYIKIRSIYKKKLNPNYQKEKKKKIQEGQEIENEEKKVIQEMKKQQIEFAEKQKQNREKRINRKNNTTQNDEENCKQKYSNDYVNIMDGTSNSPEQKQEKPDDKNYSEKSNENYSIEKLDIEQQEQNSQSKDEQQIQKLQQAYELYSEQIINKSDKNINTPPQESQLIE